MADPVGGIPAASAPPPPPPPNPDTPSTPPPTSTSLSSASQLTPQSPDTVESYEPGSPTASHALAAETVRIAPGADDEQHPQGASQIEHDDGEVKNLGWNDLATNVPVPVVGGLRNEELWTLIRRFNKSTFHVKSIEERPLADLDMHIADEEEFSAEKLRAQLERLYMVVLVSLFSFWKHIVRLRSWRERNRTATFLGVYTLAWLLDLLVPTISCFMIVLIVYPPSRAYCFPPAPPALIDANTGGLQKPPAGVLASKGSVTGAPEKHEGEAVEQEAHSFVNSVSAVCSGLIVSTAAGKPSEDDAKEDDSGLPDPTDITHNLSDAKDKSAGDDPSLEHRKAKKPVSNAVWAKARPIMHAIADFVDTWERFGNALNPVTPFPRRRPRFKLGSVVLPIFLLSLFTTPYMVVKGMGFGIGFGFFGDPIITPALRYLNEKHPNWQRFLELRNTLLKAIPTNAQLTITLLRVGERAKAPIPPPPASDIPAPVEPHPEAKENIKRLEGVTEAELHEAVTPSDGLDDEYTEEAPKKKVKKTERLLNMLRHTAKGGVNTALTADKAKAAAGARHARDRRGVVKGHSSEMPPTGPVCFPCRYKGKKGHAYITETATTPALSWTDDAGAPQKMAWTLSIGEIGELKKLGGLGWKSKLIVGWALNKEIVDGLQIVAKGTGEVYRLTAVSMRDEMFNRLISMGTQMWESW